MDDLISRAALKSGICAECTLVGDNCLGADCDLDIIYHIEHAPTVDAIPVEWLRKRMQAPLVTDANPFVYVLEAWEHDNNHSPTCCPDYCDIK